MNRFKCISEKWFIASFLSVFMILSGQHVKASVDTTVFFLSPLEGKWDITVDEGGEQKPSWLEVRHSGLKTLVGYFVGTGGSVRPISRVNFQNNKMDFTIPPQWDEGQDMVFEATFSDDKLTGTVVTADGKKFNWTGVRAPALMRSKEPSWGAPIKLFNGKDLTGWHTKGENQWVVKDGILASPRPGSNLISDQKFDDFKLHVEFRYPEHSNSGVYLRGRYEVQIEDSKGKPALVDYFGAVYGFIAPIENVAKAAGEWQSYDITLVGRLVTVVANGKMIICNQVIPGITGGALDSNEGAPGPIYFQGDHDRIEYRNIVVTPGK
jgi:hypothetical protein